MKNFNQLLLGLTAVALLASCTPVQFANLPAKPTEESSSGTTPPNTETGEVQDPLPSKLSDLDLRTELNTPIEFTAELSFDNGRPRRLAGDENGSLSIRTEHGRLEILDPEKMTVRYSPDPDFRGEDTATIILSQDMSKGKSTTTATLKIQIDSPFITLKPALAVRGTGCVMCHASVASNVITDFGYGNSYFFGGPKVPTDYREVSIYSDDEKTETAWNSTKQLGDKVIVPRAPTTGLSKVGAATLADYLKNTLDNNPNPGVKNTEVTEVSSVYIGAPTAERILQVARLESGAEVKYIPDFNQPSRMPNLRRESSGSSRYFTNDGNKPLVCSGDLIVDGVVYLNKPVIQSETGCRIYATKSVFLTGPITYSGGNSDRQNIQIVSARSINLGLGKNNCSAPDIGTNSFNYRLKKDERRKLYYTRGEPTKTVQQKLDDIYNDANMIGVDNMIDAACDPQYGRAVSFERIILNAPVVFSRYQGDFKGSIIAEIALMSLERFVFEFDPIFTKQTVLPLLKPSDYLMVQ